MPHFPFQRLQTDLAELISKAPAGTRLPSEPDLAKQLGVSRATLREAMRTCESQGLLRRRQGAGTFVVGKVPIIESGLEVLESIASMAQRVSPGISMGEALIKRLPADQEYATALDVPVGAPLIQISCTMQAGARPVAYLIDTLSEETVRPEELKDKFNGSMLDFLTQRGDPLTVSKTVITAVNASAEVAKILEIQPGDVLLQFTARLYSSTAKTIDYSFSYFLPAYFNFHVVRRVGT